MIVEAIDGIGLPQVGLGSGWALIAVVVVFIFRGSLIPRSTHRDSIAALERALEDMTHDRNEWRAESRIKDAQAVQKDTQIAEKDKQLGHMGEVGRGHLAIMQAIQSLGERKT